MKTEQLLSATKRYLSEEASFEHWEVIKYACAVIIMFSPALLCFILYSSMISLFSFMAFAGLTFGIVVLLRINRKWLIPFSLAGLFCSVYNLAIGKPLGFQTLAAMYETNLSEALGFFSSLGSIMLALVGGLVTAGLVWLLVSDRPFPHFRGEARVRKHFLVLLAVASVVMLGTMGPELIFSYPSKLVYDNYQYVDQKLDCRDYNRLHYTYESPDFDKDVNETCILIIGEAARRDSFSAYGYDRKTTPELDSFVANHPENVVLFTDTISSAAYTRATVLPLLSPLTIREIDGVHTRPGLGRIFRGAGCKTLYTTARPKYLSKNILSVFLDDAEEQVYLGSFRNPKYDEDTIPVVTRFVRNNPGRKLVIVHLRGSHICYRDQYPRSRTHFNNGNPVTDAYNDTIRYSDSVIQKLVDSVMGLEQPASIFYISDHGENLNDLGDGNIGHGTRELTRYELEIPFVFYCNNAFLREHQDRIGRLRGRKDVPLSQDNIAHTIMGISGIRDPQLYRPEYDIASEAFTVNPRYVVNENMKLTNYRVLALGETKARRDIVARLETYVKETLETTNLAHRFAFLDRF